MLQQTQVAVVVPYFERWMAQFPTIASLAAADLDQVIKAWEGLGYYSRARNLHRAAKQIMEKYGGMLPQTEPELLSIKGLGPYTVGAIRAFAFQQRAAAVDGNVLRVLARHDLVEEDISKAHVIKQLRARALEILPDYEPWVISEALIELGATVCTRTPQCNLCPLQTSCLSYAQGATHRLPNKGKRPVVEVLHRTVALVTTADRQILVRRCIQEKVMQDLHEFPSLPLVHPVEAPTQLHVQWSSYFAEHKVELEAMSQHRLAPVKHSYTRYRVTLFPVIYRCESATPIPEFFWMPIQRLSDLAFSSGHRKFLSPLLKDL